MSGRSPAYRLVRPPRPRIGRPELDAGQRAVVEHPGGPLLVLAGPGTGKTTTLVEAVATRVAAGLEPDRVLVLTFSRKAAAELRERIALRLGGTVREPVARTFHSYAFGLLRREAALRGEPAPRLLSGPEQDLVVRDLLRGDADHDDGLGDGNEVGRRRWPQVLRPALLTRGFAQELRDLLLRCHERGVGPEDLAALGVRAGREDWPAVADFLRQYDAVAGLRAGDPQGAVAYDPAELIREVLGRWRADPALLEQERAARTAVFVDEFQDTDPAQVELLAMLAGGGRDLVVVGDPDQSIYGFRGSDVEGIRRFPDRFPTREGRPAPVVALGTCRRFGPSLLRATRGVAGRFGGPPQHRRLVADPGLPDGQVEAHVLRSAGQEAALIASRLRAAHVLDGVAWSRMAVLVRSTVTSLPVLRRALSSAGVPVAVPAAEVPLVEQPAVRALVGLLDCALHPQRLDEPRAVELLSGPLGGMDALGLRRLRQQLRRVELAAGGRRSSGELLVAALTAPHELDLLPDPVRRPADRLATLIQVAAQAAEVPGAPAEEVLWAVWSASGLAGRWAARSASGGSWGAAADRDLDAVVALFEAAARFADRLPAAGPDLLLEHLRGQQIPAESLAPRAPTGEVVQILTAHAAKGLEWDLVAVAGVQEGSWPDLRARGSFLGTEQLVELVSGNAGAVAGFDGSPGELPGPSGTASSAAALSRQLDEERRLFYVATTRARRRLLVTAVRNEREGLQPSRFLDELDPLDPDADARPLSTPARALSLATLTGELRRALVEPASTDAERDAAAQLLATLAGAGVRGADPQTWHGLLPVSDDRPVREPDAPVPVSPSKVESFTRCELRWFLESVGGTEGQTAGQSVGTLVHEVAAGAVDPTLRDEPALLDRLERLAEGVDLGRGWEGRRARALARDMVSRLARWIEANPRTLMGTEIGFSAPVGRALITGRVDRLERDEQGRAVVIDLKTGSTPVKRDELPAAPQLGAYQLAVAAGGFADSGLTEPGGARLVQLGKAARAAGAHEQAQPALAECPDPEWARRLVLQVAEGMAGSAFRAMINNRCPKCPVRTSCPAHEQGRQVTG